MLWRICKIDSRCQIHSHHSHRLSLPQRGHSPSWPLAHWLETFMTVVFMHAYIRTYILHAFIEYFYHILDTRNAGKQDSNHQFQQFLLHPHQTAVLTCVWTSLPSLSFLCSSGAQAGSSASVRVLVGQCCFTSLFYKFLLPNSIC